MSFINFSAGNCFIENRKFICKDNTTCVDIEKACDDKSDCPDDSDENGKCKELKESNSCEGHCPAQAKCVYLPTGPVCVCLEGYKYNEKTEKCDVRIYVEFFFFRKIISFDIF